MRRRLQLGSLFFLVVSVACDPKKDPPEPLPPVEAPPEVAVDEPETPPVPPSDLEPAGPPEPPPPHPGPWFWVTRASAGIYQHAKKERDHKYGYVRQGGKVPVLAEKKEGPDCPKGWLELPTGGFICSTVGTMDETAREVKFRPRQPQIEDILPYPYARNAHNGTPLYKSLPPRAKMCKYEPYACKSEAAKAEEGEKPAEETTLAAPVDVAASAAAAASDGASIAEEKKETRPWEDDERLHEVTHDALQETGDAFVARWMLKGFYVAVDKTISWHGRSWYKTTKGLIAPADRMWQTKGSEFHGLELKGEDQKYSIGWVYGAKNAAPTYGIEEGTQKLSVKGSAKKWTPLRLTGNLQTIAGKDYLELTDGSWIRQGDIRRTTPGPRPSQVGPNERWIDVDISQQTLVAFEGDVPMFATLLSSGRESKIKGKDHSTPRGMWRVREKHVVATMDGDGTAAGDLPYSIEDVPYVMYFFKSYATHGAFWHQNFGNQMSHGCVNLAPLDAKWVFYFASPTLYEGYHGAWATEDRQGSWVVVHD